MERFRYLFDRYVAKTATIAERLDFQQMLQSQEYDVELKSLIDCYFSTFEAIDHEPILSSSDEILRAVLLTSQQTDSIKQRTGIHKLWPRIAVAASIALVVTIGGYFYYNTQHTNIKQTNTAVTDVAPGKQGATLTLANGEKIRLSEASNGELAKQQGVVVSKTTNGQLIYEIKESTQGENNLNAINTLTTAKGETYQVRLPDGSLVWLNAASSLTYSANLIESGKRRVRLDGEGYFEIAKDKAHPFVVQTDKQEVEVLGTHFNVNAYADENNVKTTLIEGSVRIIIPSKGGVVLTPGHQAILGANKEIKVEEIDAQTAVAWKNGEFVFERENIKSIMRKLARWYNVDVIYEGDVEKKALWGSISKYSNVSKVLEMLSGTGAVAFEIRGNKIIVKPSTK
jgi:ferric-dicitrate binding protein FerR (iron transport regulator)